MAPPSVSESPFFPQRAGQCVVMRVPMRQAGVYVVVLFSSLDRTDVCVSIALNRSILSVPLFCFPIILLSHLSSLYVFYDFCNGSFCF